MIKDPEYYLNLNLDSVASELPQDNMARRRSEKFGDLITSLYFKSKDEKIVSSKLVHYLGEPDRKLIKPNYEVWEYDWVGVFNGNEFESKTPFKVINGQVSGLEKSA